MEVSRTSAGGGGGGGGGDSVFSVGVSFEVVNKEVASPAPSDESGAAISAVSVEETADSADSATRESSSSWTRRARTRSCKISVS